MDTLPELGADAHELASAPGLMIDLALSLVPRRIATASALLTLLGGYSRDKVHAIFCDVKKIQGEMADAHRDNRELFYAARELLATVAKLENAVFTLVIARAKRGLAIVPVPRSA